MSQSRDLTAELMEWLPDEGSAWQWLGAEVSTSPAGGTLLYRPSKPESFRCAKTGRIFSLRARTLLEGRLPLRKWLVALVMILHGRCLPKCKVLSEQLGRVVDPSKRGTSPSGASGLLKTIKQTPISEPRSWWHAVGEPQNVVLPWLLVERLAKRFCLGRVTASDWETWVQRKRPSREQRSRKDSPPIPHQHTNSELLYRYLFEIKPYDLRIERKLFRAIERRPTLKASWFSIAGLKSPPRLLWREAINSKSPRRTLTMLRIFLPDDLYTVPEHELAKIVQRFQLRRSFEQADLAEMHRIHQHLIKKYGSSGPTVALIDCYRHFDGDQPRASRHRGYVIRAKIPGRPILYFCSGRAPNRQTCKSLIRDLEYLVGSFGMPGWLHVHTQSAKFRTERSLLDP